MAGETFYIKRNDTAPVIEEILKLGNVAINLTTATHVRFHLVFADTGVTKVNAEAVVVGPLTNGDVKYQWVAGDTDTSGVFKREWEITFADGTVMTVPNDEDGYLVIVTDDLI